MEMKINSEGLLYKKDWRARQKFWKKKVLFCWRVPPQIVGIHEFKWNFRKFKERLKGKKGFETPPDSLNAHERAIQADGQLFGLRLPT